MFGDNGIIGGILFEPEDHFNIYYIYTHIYSVLFIIDSLSEQRRQSVKLIAICCNQ